MCPGCMRPSRRQPRAEQWCLRMPLPTPARKLFCLLTFSTLLRRVVQPTETAGSPQRRNYIMQDLGKGNRWNQRNNRQRGDHTSYFPHIRLAAATMFSTVMPKCFSSTSSGAGGAEAGHADERAAAADVFFPTLLDAQFDRHAAGHIGRQHGVAIFGRLLVEKFPAGQAHHAGFHALGGEFFVSRHAKRNFAARADENHIGLAVGGIGQDVAALCTPAAGAYFARSSVGRFCRVSTNAAGCVLGCRTTL